MSSSAAEFFSRWPVIHARGADGRPGRFASAAPYRVPGAPTALLLISRAGHDPGTVGGAPASLHRELDEPALTEKTLQLTGSPQAERTRRGGIRR